MTHLNAPPGRTVPRALAAAALTAAALAVRGAAVGAQDTTGVSPDSARAAADTAPSRCARQRISSVVINREQRTVIDRSLPPILRAPFRVLLVGRPTRPPAIEPFVLLEEGEPCDEFARAESERMLRAQPYLADATVRAVDDSAGGVRLEVETVDELHPVFGLGFGDGGLSSLKLGSTNLGGNGIYVAGDWQQGVALRDGFGFRAEEYTVLNSQIRGTLNLDRNTVGDDYYAILTRPFYTTYQHTAWELDVRSAETFVGFYRPDTTRLSLGVDRRQANAAAVVRVGPRQVGFLAGGLLSYERVDPAPGGVVISKEDGVRSDTADKSVVGRYLESDRTRLGLVLGLRALSFMKAYAFDALEGPQDVGRGVQAVTTVGRGVGAGREGFFFNGTVYTGVGTPRSFVGLQTIMEVNRAEGDWENTVISGRVAWYARPSRRQTQILSLEYSGAWKDAVPYQPNLYDDRFGIRGFTGSGAPGARRLVLRAERRLILPGMREYLGLGTGVFADAGKMWAGNVPYGKDTNLRGSLGVAILAAVPRSSRLLGRLDFAVPVTNDKRADNFEVRVTLGRTGRSFWSDPRDLSPARRGAPLFNIFRL
jgi:hypothetical protein